MNLIEKNNEMLANKAYKTADERQMLKISTLTNPNDYDLYLIACCLCNYPIEEKAEVRDLRMKYFKATNNGNIDGFEHPITDYKKITSSITCRNTGRVNKYGLYEYEININDRDLVSDLWSFKDKGCLKYVDSKTFEDKLVVSISRDQISSFIKVLDKFMIGYDLDNMENGLFYKNRSTNKLVDISKLTLPFEPYPYQLEDAEKIIKKKRILLGHEMGCVSGKSKVYVKTKSSYCQTDIIKSITIEDLFNEFRKDKNIQIESYINNNFMFMPIKAVLDKGIQETIRITTSNTFVECTKDHEIYTPNGWVEAQNLSIGDSIIEKKGVSKIIYIENTDTQHVYDIAIDDIIVHNFTCNGIVVHNCGKTFISVLVGTSIGKNTEITYSTLDNLDYNDIVITDKGPLPIGKIVEENIDCKVQVIKNGKTCFVNITDRSYINVDM